MGQTKFAVAITADDKTAKGVKSAEKSLGTIPKHVSSVNRAEAKAVQEAASRNSQGIIRTFAKVEQAGARVFGGRSITSGFATRLAALGEAGAAAGEGMGAAATEGGVLASAIGAVGVAAGATIGLVAAAAYAAINLSTNWAKGASSIARTAETIGMATKDLTAFTAAAERVGVDKGTAAGTAASLSNALNSAAYGNNGPAISVLSRLNIKMRRKQDGNADIAAMLPDIADAIAKLNPYGQRVAGNALGISDSALAVFRQGSKALAGDMGDTDTFYTPTSEDISRSKGLYRKSVIHDQLYDKGEAWGGRKAAFAAEAGYDSYISAGRAIASGRASAAISNLGGVIRDAIVRPAEVIGHAGGAMTRAGELQSRAAEKIDRAAGKMLDAVGLSGAARKNNNPGNMRPVGRHTFVKYTSPEQGIVAMAGQIRYDQNKHHARNIEELIAGRMGADGKRTYGWAPKSDHNNTEAYVANVARRTGFGAQQPINFSDPAVLTALISAIIAQENGRQPYSKDQIRSIVDSAPPSHTPTTTALKVDVHMHGSRPGDRAVVTAGRPGQPAISSAIHHH